MRIFARTYQLPRRSRAAIPGKVKSSLPSLQERPKRINAGIIWKVNIQIPTNVSNTKTSLASSSR